MDEKRVCKQCGKDYTILRRNQLFCSSSCREAYKYEQRKDDIKGVKNELEELKQENEKLKQELEQLKNVKVERKKIAQASQNNSLPDMGQTGGSSEMAQNNRQDERGR
jgi:regulator of replication initiation timing